MATTARHQRLLDVVNDTTLDAAALDDLLQPTGWNARRVGDLLVADRPFASVAEILAIHSVGPKRVEWMLDKVAADAARAAVQAGGTGPTVLTSEGRNQDGATPLLSDLPESVSYPGRSYHYLTIDDDDLHAPELPADDDEPTEPSVGILRFDRTEATSVRFGRFDSVLIDGGLVVALWFQPGDVVEDQCLLYVAEQQFEVWIRDGLLRFEIGDSNVPASYRLSTTVEIDALQWRHLAIRFTPATAEETAAADSGDPRLEMENRYLARVEVNLDHEPLQPSRLVGWATGFEDKPLQFLARRQVQLDRDNNDSAFEGEIERGFGGLLARVEVWDGGAELSIADLAFDRQIETDPIMRWVPRSSTPAGAFGLTSLGSRRIELIGPEPTWLTPPLAPRQQLPQPSRAVAMAFARQLIARARETGVPSPPVFQQVPRFRSPRDAAAVQRALEPYDDRQLAALFAAGHRFSFQAKTAGGLDLTFATDEPATVGVVIVEEYQLTSFVGRAGRGRLLHTVSLAPGETTQIAVSSYRRTETEREQARSMLDSYSEEASRSFEDALQKQRTDEQESSSQFAYHAEVSGQASWGWGSVEASAGVSGEISSNRRSFQDSLSNATRQHAETASEQRQVEVTSTQRELVSTGEETAIERIVENINLSRPLNHIFYQVNQEIFSIVHLTDVRIGFFRGSPRVRVEVPLDQAHAMLGQHLTDAKLAEVWSEIMTSLRSIFSTRKDELTPVDRDGHQWHAGDRWSFRFLGSDAAPGPIDDSDIEKPRFAPGFRTLIEFDRGSTDREPAPVPFTARLPGLAVRAERLIVRTDGIVCESLLGDGWALDGYSTRLQEAEAERLEAETSFVEARAAVAVDIGDDGGPIVDRAAMMADLDAADR